MEKTITNLFKSKIKIIKNFISEDGELMIFEIRKKKMIAKKCFIYSKNRLYRFKNLIKTYNLIKKTKDKNNFIIPKINLINDKEGILITEFIESKSFKELILNKDKEIKKHTINIAMRLKEYHLSNSKESKVLTHKDFKPWNILIKKNKYYLIDLSDNYKFEDPYKDVSNFINGLFILSIKPENLLKKKYIEEIEKIFLSKYFEKEILNKKKLNKYRIEDLEKTLEIHPIFVKGKNYIKEIGIFIYLFPFFKYKINKLKNEIQN